MACGKGLARFPRECADTCIGKVARDPACTENASGFKNESRKERSHLEHRMGMGTA